MTDNSAGEFALATSDVLRLSVEEASITKQPRQGATVRVAAITREQTVELDETIHHERVEVERVLMDVAVDAMPDIRVEGDTTIIPIVEEVLIVTRGLRLKEEVRLRRIRSATPHRATVTVRAQEAVITRTEAEPLSQPLKEQSS